MADISWSSIADIAKAGASIVNTAASTYAPYAQLSMQLEQAGAQKAAGIYQRGLYEVQAIDTEAMAAMRTDQAKRIAQIQATDMLQLAQLRADQEEKIASVQAGRRLQQAKIEALNYQMQGNKILRGLRATNAAVRARAAANGIDVGSGSAAGLQVANARTAMFDVGVTDLNALMARVMGFEDASAMLISGQQQSDMIRKVADTQARDLLMTTNEQASYTKYAAGRQAAELRMAGAFAEKSGGLLSGFTVTNAALEFTQNFRNPFPTIAKAFS
jgi:hypothetical protein